MPVNRYAYGYQYSGSPSAPSTLLTGLGAYWPMNEFSDGSVSVSRVDQLGFSDLTDNNTCLSAVGILSNAVSFDSANNERLTVAANSHIAAGFGFVDFTCSIWIKIKAKTPGSVQAIWNKFSGDQFTSEYSIFWADAPADRFTFRLFTSTGFSDVVASSFGAPALNTWYHLLGWVDFVANTVNVRINGGPVDSTTPPGNPAPGGTSGILTIGGVLTAFCDVNVDEVGFWQRKLTPAEQLTLYGGGTPPAYPF